MSSDNNSWLALHLHEIPARAETSPQNMNASPAIVGSYLLFDSTRVNLKSFLGPKKFQSLHHWLKLQQEQRCLARFSPC